MILVYLRLYPKLNLRLLSILAAVSHSVSHQVRRVLCPSPSSSFQRTFSSLHGPRSTQLWLRWVDSAPFIRIDACIRTLQIQRVFRVARCISSRQHRESSARFFVILRSLPPCALFLVLLFPQNFGRFDECSYEAANGVEFNMAV